MVRMGVREAGSYTNWTWTDFMRIAARFDYLCAYCGVKPDRLDADHVVALSSGGSNSASNLLPVCMSCNSDKRDLTLDDWATARLQSGKQPVITSWSADDRRYWHLTELRMPIAA